MLDTALAQMRFAVSILFGIPFSPRSLDRLVAGLLETRNEFGSLSPKSAAFVNGPSLDEETRRQAQLRNFRRQASLAARSTAYYADLFESNSIQPSRMSYEDISRLPVTNKSAVKDKIGAFVSREAKPAYLFLTTGTTGKPTGIWFSTRELQSFYALSTIGLLLDDGIREEDIVQVSTSARAMLGNSCFIEGVARLGAGVYQTGLLEPRDTLAPLIQKRILAGKKPLTSVLHTYPSYLGKLIEYARANGLGPGNFGLERINLGGELVTAGLKRRAREIFGEVVFSEGYGMTEPWPFGGTMCEQGHLHFEPSQGMVEVLSLDSPGPAAPGEPGRLVLTPFAPFRESTILLRYDTEDVVKWIPEAYTCSMSHLPATTNILGKKRHSIRHEEGGWVFPRQVLEALESVDAVPLPARWGFWASGNGVGVEVVVTDRPATRAAITERLSAQGIPLRELYLLSESGKLRNPFPWRGDLLETTFQGSSNPVPLPTD